jgi:3-deoxy-D-manno-octulosonic-acid transferase
LSYLLYSLALAVGMLLSLPYWLYQILRHGKYRSGLAERLGAVPARLANDRAASPARRVIWVHAVSLGEVLAVSGLVEQMRRSFPQHRVLISTTTDTGQELARKRFGEENVFYFPMDFAFAVRPYLRVLRPELVVLAETEFWPNFLRLAHAGGARIAVVNARISDRSWPNYRRFRWLLRKMLAHIDLFLAQTQQDCIRLQSIGAEAGRVQVTGNLKFDVSMPPLPPIVESLRRSLAAEGAGPVLVCGSTVEGEEPPLLKAFENLRVGLPRAVMILAPRHPERFGAHNGRKKVKLWRAPWCWWIPSENSPRSMLWPMLPSSAAAWCPAAGTILSSPRRTGSPLSPGTTRKIFGTLWRYFKAETRCASRDWRSCP